MLDVKVGLADFIDGLQGIGIEIDAPHAEALLAALDEEGDGHVSLDGFVRMVSAAKDPRLA
jgi:Ca2+-binding EF-hand superfamily protein